MSAAPKMANRAFTPFVAMKSGHYGSCGENSRTQLWAGKGILKVARGGGVGTVQRIKAEMEGPFDVAA